VSIDRNADYDKTLAKLQEAVDAHPGLYHDVQTYLRERIDEVLAGAAEPLVVRVEGGDLRTLRKQADRVEESLSDIEGLDDLHVELVADVPEIEVRERLDAAEKYGLKPGDIRRAAATLLSSEEVGDLFHGARAYDVHVLEHPERTPQPERRPQAADRHARRGTVALGRVASVRVRPTPSVVHRQDGSRRIDIAANISDRSLSDIAHDVRDKLETITSRPATTPS
jgi:Cu/Ag efflux pump CusA